MTDRASGRTLVLLHALPLDGTMWTHETDLPVDSIVAPTLYAFGDKVEAWALGVLDLVGRGPLVVVGSSVGGSCALEVARLAPDRVAAIVLLGAKAGHRPEPEYRDEAIRVLTHGGMAEAWPKYWAPLFGRGADPATVEECRRIAYAQDVDDVIRGVQTFHGRPDRTEFIERWPKPLVVVSGAQDRSPSPATTAALAAAVPNGEFHLVDDAGHYVGLEQPRAVQAILRRVLCDVDAES